MKAYTNVMRAYKKVMRASGKVMRGYETAPLLVLVAKHECCGDGPIDVVDRNLNPNPTDLRSWGQCSQMNNRC